jgi:hypothetical protein
MARGSQAGTWRGFAGKVEVPPQLGSADGETGLVRDNDPRPEGPETRSQGPGVEEGIFVAISHLL